MTVCFFEMDTWLNFEGRELGDGSWWLELPAIAGKLAGVLRDGPVVRGQMYKSGGFKQKRWF